MWSDKICKVEYNVDEIADNYKRIIYVSGLNKLSLKYELKMWAFQEVTVFAGMLTTYIYSTQAKHDYNYKSMWLDDFHAWHYLLCDTYPG